MPSAAGADRMGPMLRALLLALCCAALTTAQDLFLYSAPHEVIQTPSQVTFVTNPGAHSLAGLPGGSREFRLHHQSVFLDESPEIRWGAFFGPAAEILVNPATGFGAGSHPMLVPVAGSPLPMVIQCTTDGVGFYTRPERRALPAADAQVLAAAASSAMSVTLLGVAGADGPSPQGFLAILSEEALDVVYAFEMSPSQRLSAAAGGGQRFYLANGSVIMYLSLSLSDRAVQTYQAPLPGAIISLAATRLASPAAACPADADILLLLDTGNLYIFSCYDTTGSAGTILTSLPAGVPAAGARILAPPAASMIEALPWFLILAPGAADRRDRVWRGDLLANDISWRRVVLPSTAYALDGLQLAHLAVPQAAGLWALVFNKTVLFEPREFGCSTDRSIQCDNESTISPNAPGWRCLTGHFPSPYVSSDHLCPGCVDNWQLERSDEDYPMSNPEHQCSPCSSTGCQTCSARHCLVCAWHRIPEASGPDGTTRCVEACSEGFALVAGVCRPDGLVLPRARLAEPEAEDLPGLPPGRAITAIGETWLALDPVTGLPVLPATPGPPLGTLLFGGPQEVLFLAQGDMTSPARPPARPMSLLDQALPGPVVAYAEAGPFQHGPRRAYALLMLDAGGILHQAWVWCAEPGPGACVADGPARPAPLPLARPCLMLRRLDAHRVLMQVTSTEMVLLTPDPGSQGASSLVLPATGLVSLSVAGTGRADPRLGDWLVWSSRADKVTASPAVFLDRGDARWHALQGAFVPDIALNESHAVAVLLPRGGDRPAEVVLADASSAHWYVFRPAGDMLPAGRPVDLAGARQHLGQLPREEPLATEDHLTVHFQGIALPAGGSVTPAALLLLTRTFIGLALLHCPTGAIGPCHFLPAAFVDLPLAMRLPPGSGFWLPAVAQEVDPAARAAAGLAPEHALTLLAFAPDTGPISVEVLVECPAGTFGPDCRPCHASCATCHGPGADRCSTCRHWVDHLPEECLAACPAGLFAEPQGRCTCHASCLACSVAGTGDFRCDTCPAGTGPDPIGREPFRCFACAAPCAECRHADDPAACTRCPPEAWLFEGSCLASCPAGAWPDADTQRCQPCPAGCTTCTSASICTGCHDQRYLEADGLCRACHSSCAACDNATSCAACRPGLVFLATDAGQAS
ncbi:hypothetical protein H696_05418, partial [Fonticula alba]